MIAERSDDYTYPWGVPPNDVPEALRVDPYAQAELIHLTAAVIDALGELRFACGKHGHWASFVDRPIIEWQIILGEEFGEFTKECCDAHFGKPDWNHLYQEAAQTAAMSLATLAWLRSTAKIDDYTVTV